MRISVGLMFCLCAAAGAAGTPDPGAWAVRDAVFRTVVHPGTPPERAESGWIIELDEFGGTRADTRDVVLLDPSGKEIGLDPVWRGAGRKLVLLAQTVPPAGATLYFGGGAQRRHASWTADRSLVMETRRMPEQADPRSWPGFQTAWKAATAVDGAGFTGNIFQGENPFGDSRNFLTRFTGVLKVPHPGKWTFFTMSENESYVFINGRAVTAWRADGPSPRDPKSVISGTIDLPAGDARVEYWHAGGGSSHPGMVLGWIDGGKPGIVPGHAWLHPGTTRIDPLERQGGGIIPDPVVEASDYLGYANEWYVQVRANLPGTPDGAAVEWIWPDGRKTTGAATSRVICRTDPLRLAVRVRNGGASAEGIRLLVIPRQLHEASVNSEADITRYLSALDAEDPAALDENARRAVFLLCEDFATPAMLAKWAAAYISSATPADGPWVRAQVCHLRWLARSDPRAALQALWNLPQPAKQAMRQSYARLELDLLVFGTRDASVPARVAACQNNPDAAFARFARIRLGDARRLQGQFREARESYASAMDTGAEALRGGPTTDKAMALALESLIQDKRLNEARAKLADWERLRPVAKIDADFLLWQARVHALAGDWPAALTELDSALHARPNAPEEIELSFWKARALYELGRKDDARTIWNRLIRDYPKHERAEACKQWAAKS